MDQQQQQQKGESNKYIHKYQRQPAFGWHICHNSHSCIKLHGKYIETLNV